MINEDCNLNYASFDESFLDPIYFIYLFLMLLDLEKLELEKNFIQIKTFLLDFKGFFNY